jgi:hypothetical protein
MMKTPSLFSPVRLGALEAPNQAEARTIVGGALGTQTMTDRLCAPLEMQEMTVPEAVAV